ncbi:hypothetical protein GCM10011374_39830 [Kocuria dechangensis]|uniref:Tyr recombinase domain-containing protein n=1 Tax=Kocuria dechangensis TaxID=1176249 RepID=A0A917H944_9MICC|nr:hypothetical protein [Kocuria dechangensis]GGG71197.1 hypothetical protein GCM10011374_39830 [Kocuria dechangensis]
MLEVTRRGGTRARVPITAGAAAVLEAYLGHRIGKDAEISHDDRPLFITATGKAWDPSQAFRTIRQLATDAGIPERITPQTLRDTCIALARDDRTALSDAQEVPPRTDSGPIHPQVRDEL